MCAVCFPIFDLLIARGVVIFEVEWRATILRKR